jgi:hypothetical protein
MTDNILDIVDFRDLIVGAKHGGLVCSLPNGKICRVPYMLPYVSLITRAKIPPSKELELSKKLWQLNTHFFKTIKHTIILKEADPFFQNLMKYIGFDENTSMHDICYWHLTRLIKTTNTE